MSDRAIVNCVMNGFVSEGPFAGLSETAGWKGTITRSSEAQRAGVVCVVVPPRRIIIVTAYKHTVYGRAQRRPAGSPDTGDEDQGEIDDSIPRPGPG